MILMDIYTIDKTKYNNNNNNNNFLTINQYIECAKRTIIRYYPNCLFILKDEDAISNIATKIMMADWRWNNEGSIEGYRVQCAKWAIQNHIKQAIKSKRKRKIYSLDIHNDNLPNMYYFVKDNKIDNTKKAEDVINSKCLTKTQQRILTKRFLHNLSVHDIAEEENKTKQNIHSIIKRGILRLRERFYVV